MNDVEIYRTQHCPYCDMAERLLDDLDVDYEEIDVTRDPETREQLAERTGMETVPQIFIGGEPIGGFDELRALNESGELQELLEE
ncbi:MAG: glutaredoxin 3 [Bradymonadaceae bacterium]